MSEERNIHLHAVGSGGGAEAAHAVDHGDDWNGIVEPSQRVASSRFLTDVIVDLGLCPRERVDEAIEAARVAGTTPEQVLLQTGSISSDDIARAVAERYGLDYVDLSVFKVDSASASLVSVGVAKRYDAVPISFIDDRTLMVAMADPANVLAVDDIAILTGYEVRAAVASRDDIARLLSRLDHFGDVALEEDDDDGGPEVIDLRETAEDAPVVRLVQQLVRDAVEQGASDLHLAPDGDQLRVRMRIDGVLRDSNAIPRRMVGGVVSRVKIMADLDISERRVPQDGRISLEIGGHNVDLRVVSIPSVLGEGIVIRILDKESVVMDLEQLGMFDTERMNFERAVRQSHGAVLVTGPTGSGKTTSLYAALLQVSTPEKNVVTVEDPVEYEIAGITQVQINAKAGLTFATGLRSIMRADPDVIMVGEIRDHETAQIAIEAALTGHLVLSTLHTNDAPSATTRLIEMGIEPFLVASAVDCVIAQRLVRTLCVQCKKRIILPGDVLREYGYPASLDIEGYDAVGCKHCNGTGYKGRAGIYEVMNLTSEIRALTIERRSADEIAECAVSQGMRRLRDNGLENVRQGRTTITEVGRVCGGGMM